VQLVCFPFPLPPSYYCAPLFKPFPFLPPSLPSSLLLCLLSLDATLHSNRGRIPRLGGSLYFPLACPTAILLLFRFLFSNPSLPPSLPPSLLQARELLRLLRLPSNRCCADCDAPLE